MHSMKDDWGNMGPGECIGKKLGECNWRTDSPMPAFLESSKFTLRGDLSKLNSTFLEQANTMSSIQGISLMFLKNINTERERLVLSGFYVYGYTSTWVTANLHRVLAKVVPTKEYMSKTIYTVDGKDLFAIVDKIEFGVYPFEELKANLTCRIEYIKSLQDGDTIETGD